MDQTRDDLDEGKNDVNMRNPLGLLVTDDKNNPSVIQPVEFDSLKVVFRHLRGNKPTGNITSSSLMTVYNRLGHPLTKRAVDLIIWEVDENNDGEISFEEFLTMYQRNILDAKSGSGLEPKQLYFLTQFLMYENPNKRDGTISVEQTLTILYVRHKDSAEMDAEINAIFGDEREAAPEDGYEVRIRYSDFLERVSAKCNSKRLQKKVIGGGDAKNSRQ
eukprot:GDKJ01040173.1.p1 GENE.GDKJ01040173.1~~GDKJ01040173.1.p1  ORF type:complete len:218 (+),score=41.69 GDKJ01040173.1:31-684(+)